MTWRDLTKHAAAVFLALYAGAVMPGGTCLIDCVLSAGATEIAAAPNHCNSDPVVGSGGGACHANVDAADVALRVDYRFAATGAPVFVDGPFSFLKRPARPAAAAADEGVAAHGPPGTRFPLRV